MKTPSREPVPGRFREPGENVGGFGSRFPPRGTETHSGNHFHNSALDDHGHDRDDIEIQDTVRQDGNWHWHELEARG